MMLGLGQASPCPPSGPNFNCTDANGAIWDSAGRYRGGSSFWDWMCGSTLGQMYMRLPGGNPNACSIPSVDQIRQEQIDELKQTGASPQVQVDTITAGDQAVAQACAQDPAGCAAQQAASDSPILSSLFGTAFADFSHTPGGAATFGALIGLGVIFAISIFHGGHR